MKILDVLRVQHYGVPYQLGNQDSLLVRVPHCDPKVASLNPGRSGGRIFFSRVNFVCWLLFGVRFTPVLLQRHIKDPSHSGINAGGRLHLNTHTTLTQWGRSGLTMPLSRHSVGTYSENELTHISSGNTWSVVSARWATVDWSWPKEWNKCVWANLHFKKKKKKKKERKEKSAG